MKFFQERLKSKGYREAWSGFPVKDWEKGGLSKTVTYLFHYSFIIKCLCCCACEFSTAFLTR